MKFKNAGKKPVKKETVLVEEKGKEEEKKIELRVEKKEEAPTGKLVTIEEQKEKEDIKTEKPQKEESMPEELADPNEVTLEEKEETKKEVDSNVPQLTTLPPQESVQVVGAMESKPEEKVHDEMKNQSELTEKKEEAEERMNSDMPQPTKPMPMLNIASEPVMGSLDEPSRPSKAPLFLMIFVIILLLGILGGGVWWYMSTHNMVGMFPTKVVPTPITTQVETPTATPTPKQVNLSAYTISILNGSGIGGAAGRAKTFLTTAGFTISDVGNATTSDYTLTVITAKKSVDSAYLDKLVQTLQQNYAVSSTILTATASQTADVVVTVGKSTK